MMTIGTFCSGIGAPECAGMGEPLWFCEIDPFPSAVLEHRFPGVPNLGDMTAPDLLERIATVGLPDIVVAGLPCQPFSVAGLRKGLEDPRNLTVRFVELADAIDDLRCAAGQRPVWWCVENVPGLLSDGDNAFGALLGGLVGDDAAIDRPAGGWTNAGVVAGPRRVAAWRVLDAQHFGVAQRRRRIFVLALGHPGAWACADALLPVIESLSGHPAPSREAGTGTAVGALAGTSPGGGWRVGGDEAAAGQLLPVAYGGNNTAGPIDVATARNAHAGPHGRLDFESETFVATTLRARDGAEGVDSDCTDTLVTTRPSRGGGQAIAFSSKDHGADAGDIAPTLRAMGHSGSHANAGGQVAVAFHENQRGELTVNDTAGSLKVGGGKPGQGYPAIAFHARQDPDSGPVTHPLDTDGYSIGVAFKPSNYTRDKDGAPSSVYPPLSADADKGDQDPVMFDGAAVRRLTPLECERLQGFPDGWTAIPMSKRNRDAEVAEMVAYFQRTHQDEAIKAGAHMAADGPRYKALGNSMAVPCMAYIGERIRAASEGTGR